MEAIEKTLALCKNLKDRFVKLTTGWAA